MKIKSIVNTGSREKTYDLSVKENHNYFVGEDELLVHNSGKDPTKVDRSASYAARWVAKNIVAAGLASKCEVQIAYAIGVAHPVSINVNTFGTAKEDEQLIEDAVKNVFDLRPASIIKNLNLLNVKYEPFAAYGHMGREDLDAPWERVNKDEDLLFAINKLKESR